MGEYRRADSKLCREPMEVNYLQSEIRGEKLGVWGGWKLHQLLSQTKRKGPVNNPQ